MLKDDYQSIPIFWEWNESFQFSPARRINISKRLVVLVPLEEKEFEPLV